VFLRGIFDGIYLDFLLIISFLESVLRGIFDGIYLDFLLIISFLV
jgi:hypothetical protein